MLTEESVDSNYDPSDAFFNAIPARKEDNDYKIQDDLAVSESDEEDQKPMIQNEIVTELQPTLATEEDVGKLWF